MDIQNKVVVITGAASGMGAETARYFASLGAKVALLDRDIAAAQKIADEIKGLAFECDVTQAAAVESAIQAIVKAYSDIHIGINCAGIATAGRVVGRNGPLPLADFNQVIQVNLVGTFNVVRILAAQMMQQNPYNQAGERGVLINTASVAAFDGQIGQAAYSASKGGIVSMTLPLARELAKWGIRVMTIAPGVMATPMMAGMPDEVEQGLKASVPFPKRLGAAVEYAKLAAHIVENDYLNGEVIRLDGALRMASK